VRVELEGEADTLSLHRRLAEHDPLAASRMEPTNRRRIIRALEVTVGAGRPFSSFGPGLGVFPEIPTQLLGLRPDLGALDARIDARVHDMLDAGWLDEVRGLTARGVLSRTARQALGYRELLEHLEAGISLEQSMSDTVQRTRRFARRQIRWFRRDPRLRWLDAGLSPSDLARSVDV
jgi:tRNA dimethylallyltransferase